MGTAFRNPRGATLYFQRIGKAYVDDTDLWLALELSNLQETATEMEDIAQFWEQLLFTTDGALALEKCFFTAIAWRFENDEYKMLPKPAHDLSIKLSAGHSLKGKCRHVDRKSNYNWANQESPLAKAWALWNCYLRKLFCKQSRGSTKLQNPLGSWVQGNKPIHQTWYTSFVDPETKSLVRKAIGSDVFCIHRSNNDPHIFHEKYDTTFNKPRHLIPVTIVARSGQYVQITKMPANAGSFESDSSSTPKTERNSDPRTYVNGLHSFFRNSLGHSDILDSEISTLATELYHRSAVIASDGSSDNTATSFPATQGWVVYGIASKTRACGRHGSTNGGGLNSLLLCPEIGGLCGALSAVDVILGSCPEENPTHEININA